MSKKTIALLVNTSWNIYNFRMNIVKALTDEGYEVLCIAPQDNYSMKLVSDQVKYIPVKMENRGVNPWRDFLLFLSLCKVFRTHRPDAILQFTIKPNIYGSMAARLAGIPVINNVSGLGTVFLNNNLSSKVAMGLYKVAFRSPFKVFFQNSEDRALFIDRGLVKESITQVIPGSGVNLNRFAYQSYKRKNPFVFLMASRLIHDKGLFEYLEACNLLNAKFGEQVECWLQGAPADTEQAGITKEQMQSILSGYAVKYFPFTDSIEEFLKKAEVVVLPSYREGVSRMLLESAAMGKPLIATDVPGCREIVRSGYNGLLCKVKDAKDLSRAMIAMFEKSEKELQTMGAHSRQLVEKEFSDEVVTSAYLKAINEALIKTER
ncbi:MAG: glycosyl transferase [Cytophagaceae bacterium]|jgi:glycosyltransferase involved in cell wall biosynthesis|nr:glycosyl transferase [Cytophagaceae bacterium]